MPAVKLTRPQTLARDIVVVDGMSSSGKSLISPVLSSLSRVQLWQICEWYEYLFITHRLKKLSKDGIDGLLNTFADLDLYNTMIGRRVNFRTNDLTGVERNLLREEYQKRATGAEGQAVIDSIQTQKPVLNLMTHYVFGSADVFFNVWGDRLKLLILPVRHPLWLIDKWNDGEWDKRMGKDPRDVQLCVNVNGKTVPWFAASWSKQYLKLKPLERSIAVVEWFIRDFDRQFKKLQKNQKSRVVKVPFEYFAVEPSKWIDIFCVKLGAKRTTLTQAMLKKLDLPRKTVTADYQSVLNKVNVIAKSEKTSPKSMATLKRLCREYEKEYPSCLKLQ